ncbi:phosphate butyryltransferase [Sporomusaceae bacterium BoRhaA]|uniref:phosphate acyltransferase n=1 Tax=Pelorhabdus rhamnosifermentans TaxID=2772457 RepID=UPI001C05F78E|nr:phosphate acyltransferase [Pelorhabdus rhamnosifermentans]MBU2699600.1 phosphate butyryltransferase [Pelorhabdus rhamnosifermentans]
MLQNFREVLEKARQKGSVTVSVAVAQDLEVLAAVKAAQDAGLIRSILVGNVDLIKPMLSKVGLPLDTPLVHEEDDSQAALIAVSLVKEGKADILMKGMVNSGTFLKAVLNSEVGLRTGRLLSHLAVFEIPGEQKLAFHTDGGMNIAPTLEEKKDILINALIALKALGIDHPNVAILTANEMVNSKMPATVDAQTLVTLNEKEHFTAGIIEGPIAMDVAASKQAAEHKGIKSQIAGAVDLFVVPNIEAGNLVGKTLVYYAKAKNVGIVVGATHPIVMASRSATAEEKLNAIALACLAVPR